MKTQQQWVVKQLLENGRVSRNEALRNYISRLGAIVNILNRGDWVIKGGYERTHGGYGRGKDYVYKAVSYPQTRVEISS